MVLRQEHAAGQLFLVPTSQMPRHDIVLPAMKPSLDKVDCFAPMQQQHLLYIVAGEYSFQVGSHTRQGTRYNTCYDRGRLQPGHNKTVYILGVRKDRKVSDKPGHAHTACESR